MTETSGLPASACPTNGRLAIVGDLFLTAELSAEQGADDAFRPIREAVVAFANLEAPLTEGGAPSQKWINMKMAPALLGNLRTLGFDVFTIANNHLMDYGYEGFADTLRHLRAAGFPFVGGGEDLAAAWAAHVVTLGGKRVALLGGSSTLGATLPATEERPGVAPVRISESYAVDANGSLEQPGSAPYVHTRPWAADVKRAREAIRIAKSVADFVVIAMHWGVPPLWRSRFQDGLAEYQVTLAEEFAAAGADLIVGHHPHSLQTIARVGRTPVFHSLGNFIFHHNRLGAEPTMVAQHAPYSLSVGRDRQWKESVVLVVDFADATPRYRLHPVLLDDAGNPQAIAGPEARKLFTRLGELSPGVGFAWDADGDGSTATVEFAECECKEEEEPADG
ncbi:MAG: CapA family protein [Anaerolineaceae bacterium]|nr:CapA family protein [Anaerolineaceae bacterium]